MLIKSIFYFFGILIWSSSQAKALGPFHLDLHLSAGQGSARFENKTKDKPITYQYGAGVTVGYSLLGLFYLGVSGDYYTIMQTTEPNSEWGNRKGTRTNLISPTLGFMFTGLHFKYDYQMKGTYKLDKKDSSGREVSYEDPKGHRIYLGYKFGIFTEMGILYEKLTYETEVKGSSSKKLKNEMELTQIGLMTMMSF